MLERIRSNIDSYGHHMYLITGGASPRFAYTIGVSQSTAHELVLAGASFYSADEVKLIVNTVAARLKTGGPWQTFRKSIDSLGTFSLRVADSSWVKKMLLGALDYFELSDIPVLQILPEGDHWTVDIPDMSKPWDAASEPVWRWLDQKWDLPVPENSVAITNIDALKGKPITEAMRWEEDQWEMFAGAGPDVEKEDIREVALGTLLGADQSLYPVANLSVGKGIWRNTDELEWHSWE